ncbi:heavy metal translocating P-type ATPase [Microbacterium sp. SS28]|uniref:heavy metal translocating P-type ATPase n=1 Tax=Microbacterium sp. SS28 TaxID=2919948 RepID=UPI001FAAC6F6|nr:heavy metal translocating P-type ATPase [Microbacterium sp. SS28]
MAALAALGIVVGLSAVGANRSARWVAVAAVITFVGWTIARMVRDVMRGHVGLDVLAVVAMVATLAVGEYVAALIIVLMLAGGEALEEFASRRARRDLTALLDRSPRIAHVLTRSRDSGRDAIADVPVDDVAIGDVLLVRPSEIVPVDGMLLGAEASFDESSLTGESMPVLRSPGEEVMSGAINGGQVVRVQALRLSADSQYQQIVALVRDAESSRAPVVRLADRFAIPFTAVSLAIAGLAWLFSGDPTRFAEVLVLATPCPLLIAAPVAFVSGMSRAARNGVVVKDGSAIERLAQAKTAAFDKTGTLTRGKAALIAVRPAPGFEARELLRLAASAEQYSTHVLAEGIRHAAVERGMTLADAEKASEAATDGVMADIEGHSVTVGKRRFIQDLVRGVPTAEIDPGQAAAYVAVDGCFAGTLILADDPRPESRAVVDWLLSHGVERVAMLTGDARTTAEEIGRAVGIDEVHAELLPAEKIDLAAGLQPRPVVMVGDGINDAPVLAASDVGVAMGAKGATAAGAAADIVVLVDSLAKVVEAVSIARRTLTVALTAIWIGMGVSLGLMLVATTGAIPAVAGALTQELVDLATILFALRALSGRPIDLAPSAAPIAVGLSARPQLEA